MDECLECFDSSHSGSRETSVGGGADLVNRRVVGGGWVDGCGWWWLGGWIGGQ